MYTFWFFIYVLLQKTAAIKINLILVSIGQNPAYGYISTTPVYYAALDNLKTVYPEVLNNVSVHLIYQPGSPTCAQAGDKMMVIAGNVSTLLARLDGLSVILTPACSAEMLILGDYAREWNVAVLSSTAGDQGLANKQRYPTVVTCAPPDHLSISLAARQFLRQYSWNTVTFLCDDLSSYPGLGSYFYLSCRNIKKRLEMQISEFLVYVMTFDSPLVTGYETMLRTVQRQSRVVMLYTLPSVVREIMVLAHKLNMTNGDYIFLSTIMTRMPGEGVMDWRKEDGDDLVALEAFQSLIYFQNPNPDWNKVGNIQEAVNRETLRLFNVTLNYDAQFNDFVISGYELFSVLAMALNETYTDRLLDGRRLAKQFWGRSVSFPWRKVRFGYDGMRGADVLFYRLNTAIGMMQESWRYYSLTSELTSVSSLSKIWRGPDGPPLNVPLCGYLGNQCEPPSSHLALIAGLVSVGVVLAIAAASLYCWWTQRGEQDEFWWWLDRSLFLLVPVGSRATEALTQTAAVSDHGFYNGKKVWYKPLAYSMTFREAQSIKKLREVLRQLKSLHHEHICCFLGLVMLDRECALLYEYASRGSLRSFLDQKSGLITPELQNAFIWDFLAGVRYIAHSSMQLHGLLSSLVVLLNERFCIKIVAAGVTAISHSLGISPDLDECDSAVLWMAPEVLSSSRPSKASDVYSAGIVIAEILTRRFPYDKKTSAAATREGISWKKPMGDPIKFGDETDPGTAVLIGDCWDNNPAHRSTLKQLMAKLEVCLPRNKRGVIDSLMGQLEKYSHELERRVEERSHELVREEAKVNGLLLEMIPASLIRKLRNKETILAEQFDNVTLCFSDFPAFHQLSATSEPVFLMHLLNQIYVLFDRLLERFDVYKVETIADSLVVASGLPVRNGNKHAGEICSLALALLEAARPMTHNVLIGLAFELRIGVNTGPCVAGVVGQRMPRYCLFGDTVNMASRMESHGAGGKIHLSPSSRDLLGSSSLFRLESRGPIQIKGKGIMETFWLSASTM